MYPNLWFFEKTIYKIDTKKSTLEMQDEKKVLG